ncbi:metal-dependent hydrolase [Rummeliibacillus sp. JY-2-4R]
MTGKTHILGGIAAGLAYAHFEHVPDSDAIILVGASVVGALLPDICHSGSIIGRKFHILSKIINTLFGHRTFTHSLLFLLLMAMIMNTYVSNVSITSGILIGMVSHYLLDMSTKNGIKLFFPLDITVRLPITTRTGSQVEHVVAIALTVISVYLGFETIRDLL